jgi:hypothetical protein
VVGVSGGGGEPGGPGREPWGREISRRTGFGARHGRQRRRRARYQRGDQSKPDTKDWMYLNHYLGGLKVEQHGADSPAIGEQLRRLCARPGLWAGHRAALAVIWVATWFVARFDELRAARIATAPHAPDASWKAGHGVHMEQAVARRRGPRAGASNRGRFRPPSASDACANAPQSRIIVVVVIQFAHGIGMTVMSPGVEAAEHTLAQPLATATHRCLPANLRPSFEPS